ncbi:MAG: PHP domain-containing protein [Cellulosilyticaceae bacterium]
MSERILIHETYHKHTYDSNIYMTDSDTSIEDYAKRAVELGQKTLSTVEHGYCGRFLVDYDIAKKYGLKLIIGAEAYWVNDRLENDKTNNHILIMAKNENGRQWLNEVLSQANETGLFNGRPRVDKELLMLLPPNDVFITSACIGFNGYGYEYSEEMIKWLHERFNDNFMLEVQYHYSDAQKNYNKFLLNMSEKYGIKIIMGTDSHMIDDSQSIDRDDLLASKNITYADEDGWFMDTPDTDTAYSRFVKQGVLSSDQIINAIENTNIVLTFDEFYFDKEPKMITLYPDKTQEEKDRIYKELVVAGWNEYKKTVPIERHREYMDAIKEEVKVVVDTGMADYFIFNHYMIKRGIEKGGVITPTARGSASSFFTNTLLGFGTMDRLYSDVKLFPERFMSTARILESKSLPDIDFNLATPHIFEEAQKEILGDDHSYPFIALGTLRPKSALKMYARSQDLDSDIAQAISDQIGKFEHDYNKAEDDAKEDIHLLDYIDEEYHPYIEASEKYLGIIMDKKKAPCGYLLYNGSIRREFGLIRIKPTKGDDVLCANIEGATADFYGYVKNDLLKVTVHLLVQNICNRAGIQRPTSKELLSIVDGDKDTWDIYEKGLTCLVNQVDGDGTKAKAMKYKPKNYSELSALVAAIRPGFRSLYSKFEKREAYDFGVKQIDDLLQTESFPYSYLLYQENIMVMLNYTGIPMSECYDVIKAISKKKVEKIRKVKQQFSDGMTEKLKQADPNITEDRVHNIIDTMWTVIIDAARYSFNSSHSLAYAIDSIYGAWLKAHYTYEFYEVALQMYSDQGKKDKVNQLIKEMKEGFGIDLGEFKFRADNRAFNIDKENKMIHPSILSIKNMNSKVTEELYEMRDTQYDSFIDVLIHLLENTILTKTHINILIKIGYFSEFGKNKKLDMIYEQFQTTYKKTHTEKTKVKRRETMIEFEMNAEDKAYSVSEQLQHELDLLGYCITTYPQLKTNNVYMVSDFDNKYGVKCKLYSIKNGETTKYTAYKNDYDFNPFAKGTLLQLNEYVVKRNGVDLAMRSWKVIKQK